MKPLTNDVPPSFTTSVKSLQHFGHHSPDHPDLFLDDPMSHSRIDLFVDIPLQFFKNSLSFIDSVLRYMRIKITAGNKHGSSLDRSFIIFQRNRRPDQTSAQSNQSAHFLRMPRQKFTRKTSTL